MVKLDDIRQARARIAGRVHRTGLDLSSSFSGPAGGMVYLKPENLQKTGSFKIRGAANYILQLDRETGRRGVIAASSGNHGQAVACAAGWMGYPSTVVLPEAASPVKVEAARAYGAEVIRHGSTSVERLELARRLAEGRRMTFIHAFDDPRVIAGQGTVGLEILEDLPDVDQVVVPVGGGGLIAGVALAVKSMQPRAQVIGVEPERANALQLSLEAGAITGIDRPTSIADGLLPSRPGDLPFTLAQAHVDGVIAVTDEELRRAVLALLERARLVVEPSGAAGLAAILAGKIRGCGRRTVVVLSGGNLSLDFLSRLLAERAGEQPSMGGKPAPAPGHTSSRHRFSEEVGSHDPGPVYGG
ncbi:MAG TPA: threonine/serine dehydratase [Bacillota bacterium]|nr:threonine/serine dehydratase [Bacillota bacterium]